MSSKGLSAFCDPLRCIGNLIPPDAQRKSIFAGVFRDVRYGAASLLPATIAPDVDSPCVFREGGMIKKVAGGYKVLSEKGKNLGGPYKTRKEAAKRLRQVEFFKHKK